MTGRSEYRQRAERIAAAFTLAPDRLVHMMPLMYVVQRALGASPLQIIIAGSRSDADTRALLRVAQSAFLPDGMVLLADGGESQQRLARRQPYLAEVRPVDGHAAAYVCRNFTCEPPEIDPAQLALQLKTHE